MNGLWGSDETQLVVDDVRTVRFVGGFRCDGRCVVRYGKSIVRSRLGSAEARWPGRNPSLLRSRAASHFGPKPVLSEL